MRNTLYCYRGEPCHMGHSASITCERDVLRLEEIGGSRTRASTAKTCGYSFFAKGFISKTMEGIFPRYFALLEILKAQVFLNRYFGKKIDGLSGPDPDDVLASKHTDENGYFELEGFTTELTTIDPHLKIYHDCNDGIIVRIRDVWRRQLLKWRDDVMTCAL